MGGEIPSFVDTSGHAGDNCYEIINEVIIRVRGIDDLYAASLGLRQLFDVGEAETGEPSRGA
jgi:hypothetical protein